MTVICGGGTSSVKPGVAAAVIYGSGLIADLLVTLESAWLIPVIPLLGLPPLATATFCSSDPPASPTFTSAEADALLGLKIGTTDWNNGVAKVSDAIQNALWGQLCECNNGTAAPQPQPIPLPTGVPQLQLPSGPNFGPCASFTFASNSPQGGTTTLSRGGTSSIVGLGATSFTGKAVNTIAVAPGSDIDFIWEQAGTGTPTFKTTRHVLAGHTDVVSVPIQSGCTGILLTTTSNGNTGTSYITNSKVDVFCGGSGQPVSPTACPPDPTTQALLEAILQMVTLIQRQHVPFAYIAGTAHGPLHGSGEFNLDDVVLGLQVDVTGIDDTVGVAVGDPTRLFNVGYLAVGDADGFWCSKQITSEHQLFFPQSAGAATKVGWSTNAGASITVTELKRES